MISFTPILVGTIILYIHYMFSHNSAHQLLIDPPALLPPASPAHVLQFVLQLPRLQLFEVFESLPQNTLIIRNPSSNLPTTSHHPPTCIPQFPDRLVFFTDSFVCR